MGDLDAVAKLQKKIKKLEKSGEDADKLKKLQKKLSKLHNSGDGEQAPAAKASKKREAAAAEEEEEEEAEKQQLQTPPQRPAPSKKRASPSKPKSKATASRARTVEDITPSPQPSARKGTRVRTAAQGLSALLVVTGAAAADDTDSDAYKTPQDLVDPFQFPVGPTPSQRARMVALNPKPKGAKPLPASPTASNPASVKRKPQPKALKL